MLYTSTTLLATPLLLLLAGVIQLPSTLAQVTSCSSGSYLSSGSCITCTDYTLGRCPGGTSPQTVCAAGESPTYDFTACVTTPTTCSDGYLLIAYSQASVCQPCFLPLSNGNFANNICINNVSTTCASSTFANANATRCVTGISLTFGTPGCRFGEYIGNRVCRTCPDNRVCVGNFFPPYACGSGKVLSADKTTCVWDGATACPAGTWAPISIAGPVGAVTDPYCMPCPENTICTGGTSMPTVCPAGTWPNSNTSATSCIVQTSCFPGTFLQNGGCPPCPSGYYCIGGTSQPTTCPIGQYPSKGSTVSLDLTGMMTCSNPSSCKVGMFKNATGCWSCPLGAVCTGGVANFVMCPNSPSCPTATTCPSGSYLDNGVCYKCINDWFICSGGTSPPELLPEGYVKGTFTDYFTEPLRGNRLGVMPYEANSVARQSGFHGVPIPASCPAGMYLHTPSSTCPSPTSICETRGGCIDCPAGHFCSGGTSAPVQCTGGLVPNWNSTLGAVKSFCVQPDVPCPGGFVSTAVRGSSAFIPDQAPGFSALSGLFFQPSCVVSPDKRYPYDPTTESPTIFTDVAPGGFVPPLICQVLYSANIDNTRCVLTPPSCPPGTFSTTHPHSPLLRNPLFNQNAYGYGPGWITNPSKCIPCEDSLRSSCPGGNLPSTSVLCPNGHIKSANSTTCIPAIPAAVNGRCNAGFIPNGYDWGVGQSAFVCQKCSDGFICGGLSDETPTKCGVGKVPTVNATICSWDISHTNHCSGTYNANATSCVWDGVTSCPAGTYGTTASRLDEPYCQPCPMFAVCAGGSALPVGCPFGTGPNPTSTACIVWTSCSAGMFLSNGRCSFCPMGYACAGGTAAPVLCPFNLVPMDANNKPAIPSTEKNYNYVAIGERQGGFPAVSCGVPPVCPVAYFLNSTGCWPCPPGLACPGGTMSPRNCSGSNILLPPSNPEYCGTLAAANPFIRDCGVGRYIPTGLKFCAPCPSGSACSGNPLSQPTLCTGNMVPNRFGTCQNPDTTCTIGHYLSGRHCIPCPAGAICPGGLNSFTMCPIGQVPRNNLCQDIELSCAPGFSIGRDIAHLPRPAGIIWNWGLIPAYSLVCTACRSNLLCPGGFAPPRHCPEHTSPDINQTACGPYSATCPLGYKYATYGGNGGIESLYWSGYSNSIYIHGNIGAGNRPSQQSHVCEKCFSSQLCPGGFKSGGTECPWGTQPSLNQTVCLPIPNCPAGRKSLFGVCSPCPTGPFFCTGGTSPETSCGTGKGPNAGATACVWDNTTICAAGTYINPSTSSTNPYCAACTAGNYCLGGSSAPVACSAGQIVNSGATACSPCPSGLVCPGGSSPAAACGTGKVPNVNATACVWDSITVCAAGTYINPSTTPSSPFCASCTAGNACAGGSASPVPCVAGQIVNSGATACDACPSGLVCTGGSSPAAACGTGKVPNVNATGCVWDGSTICAAGTYINPITTTTAAYCANCTTNNFCAGGSAAPAACPAGQYVNSGASVCFIPTSCNVGDYLVGSTGCFPCPSGSSCAGGTAAAVACGAGQLPNVDKSACVASASTCTSGNFLYKVNSSDTAGICLSCPSVPGMGFFCPGGTAGLSCSSHINFGYTCKQCPPDNAKGFCSGNSISCRAGTGQVPEYMINDSGNDCIEIPAGICPQSTYDKTTIGGITVCDECPRGKFCPGKGAGARTCPPSQYPNQMLVPAGILGAFRCMNPLTTCSAGATLVDGICVSNSGLNPVNSNNTTPSAALVTKCQAAVQTAIAGGGSLAYAYFEFIAFGGPSNPKEWRCRVIVDGQPCPGSAPTPTWANTIASSLCGSTGGGCNNGQGFVSVSGNGVSGGSCGGGGGGGGPPPPSCVGSPSQEFIANCTTPGNNVQCVSGAFTCAPAGPCTGAAMPRCLAGVNSVCSNNKWECRICANAFGDLSPRCSGANVVCSANCGERTCHLHQTCPPGQYLQFPTPSLSNISGTCISPASGSLSCPAGQFLVPSPILFSGIPSANNQPPAMHFQCAPCPIGYICAGGTGAIAWINVSASNSPCPSTGSGFTTGFSTGSGLTSVAGYSSPSTVVFRVLSSPNQATPNADQIIPVRGTGISTIPTPVCIVQIELASTTWTTPGNYRNNVPFVGCDPNFFMYAKTFVTTGSLCFPCPSGSYSPGGYVTSCSLCPNTPPTSCPAGQTVLCSNGAWSCQPITGVCASAPAACTAGSTWSNSGNSPCTACTTCSGAVTTACNVTADTVCASAPASCVAGSTWSNSGNAPCTACTTCSGAVATACTATADTVCASAPASCVAGSTWSNSGTAPCTACTTCSGAVTTACTTTSNTVCASAPATCVAGSTWSNSGNAPCTACTTCSGANSIVTSACTTTANTVCGPPAGPTSCPVGQYVSGSTCTWCPAGTYQNSSSFTGSSCTSCPSGTFGLGGSTTASCAGTLTCAAGNYSLPGATSVDITNPTVCVSCASGLTSPSGSSSSAACVTPVSSCNAGEYLSGSACVLCPVGTYQNASSFTGSSCTSCPSGISTTNSATGSVSVSDCTICAPGHAGTVTGSGTVSAFGCTICPVGKYSLAGASTCTDCPAGTWGSTSGLTSASCSGSLSCNAGTYALPAAQSNTLSSTSVCAQCPAGTISTAGSTSSSQCSTCVLGKYSLAGSSSCTDCPAGTWGATSGLQNASCTGTCAPGKYSAAGSSSCTDCASGLTSPSGSTSSSACVTPSASCNAGSYLSGSACVLCPAGTYQDTSSFTGSSCTACPSGISSTNSATGSTSISACTICAPGYAGTVQCPPNYPNTAVCAGTSLASGCTICPLGKYALASASTCSNCPGGTWGATTGLTSASCTGTCGLGKYSTAGSSSCTDCPAGTWGATSGLQAASCSGTCPAGKYSTIGSSVCTDCPAGLTSLPGSTSSSACVTPAASCNAGYYLDQSTCVACPAGTYQTLSSYTGSSCTACPSGISTTGSATASISISACTICAPGYAGSVTGSGTSNAAGCTICGLGKYSLAGASACINCPAGTWGETTGLTTSACSGTCAAGNYSTAGSSSCSLCPAGSYGATSGMQGAGCSGVCPDGKYSTAGSSSCTDCPAGTWGIRGGAWNAPIGLTNASCSGTCPAGTTSAAGSTASNMCSACTSGKYALAGDPTCTLCPAGTWGQTIGLQTPACTGTCPAGKYSAAGAFICSNCPSGQTSPPGSTSINACVPAVSCVAGSTWSSAGTAPCTACATCSGANSAVTSACTVTSNTVCGAPAACVTGSTWSTAGTAPCSACATCAGNSVVTSACTATADTVCSSSGPNSCVAGSTWSSTGSAPCTACSTCPGPNRIVVTTCKVNADSICGCDSGSTVNSAGTGCLPTAVVVMPYSISSPTLCSAAGVVDSVLKPTSGVALSLRGNLSVALGIPSSAAFIVAVTACDSTTTLVAQNAPVNTAVVPGGIPGRRRLQTAALNTSSLSLLIDGQTLVITLGFTIPNSVAPAMSAFLSASMSGTASPATMATLASNLQQLIQSSGAASSPQLNMLLSDISSPSSSSSSNAANAFSKRLNSVPVSAAAPMAASLGVSVASLGITNNTVKGVPSAIAVSGNPLAVAPTTSSISPESGGGGLGGLGALVLLVILPACGYYFFVYRKKNLQGEEKKEGSDAGGEVSKGSGAIDSADIKFDVISPMRAGLGGDKLKHQKENGGKASFEPKQVDASNV